MAIKFQDPGQNDTLDISSFDSPLFVTKESFPEFHTFYPCDFFYDGLHCQSAEHAMQAAKFLDVSYKKEILSANTVFEAKVMGNVRHSSFRKDWNKAKVDIAASIQMAKFSSDDILKDKLLATMQRPIIFCGYQDLFWCCNENGEGMNMNGLILDSVRWCLFMLENLTGRKYANEKRRSYQKQEEK
jgi:hypothetical protein